MKIIQLLEAGFNIRSEKGRGFPEHNFGYHTDTKRVFKIPESAKKDMFL